jgi:hypothetical protein
MLFKKKVSARRNFFHAAAHCRKKQGRKLV